MKVPGAVTVMERLLLLGPLSAGASWLYGLPEYLLGPLSNRFYHYGSLYQKAIARMPTVRALPTVPPIPLPGSAIQHRDQQVSVLRE